MPEALIAAIGVVLSAVISGAFGYAIKRSADRSSSNTARNEIEAAAFRRAEEIYVNALNHAKSQRASDLAEIRELRAEVEKLENELELERQERREAVRHAQEEITAVRLELKEKEATLSQLKRIVTLQQAGQSFPVDLDTQHEARPPPPAGPGTSDD